ncbi:unnamed protein product [Spirodela intermedia]|uniref:Uncharacterized protein n=1 Tax=Spirodela intermedia TaxID=51605 RepID=A0A7I8IHP7_SPIIN|nr:unnamed protein product [Spirodela intermedia]CAA6657401.1 unnamed protein product [Spirodela intermedia]
MVISKYPVFSRFILRTHHLSSSSSGPDDPSALLRVCTVLFQQQNSSDERLHSFLRAIDFDLSHEFFLQICNRFPCSWRPVLRFFRYADGCSTDPRNRHSFSLTPVAVNKMIDIIGKSKNIQLLWDFLGEMAPRQGLVNLRSMQLAVRAFAQGRQIKKCVGVFDLFHSHGPSLCTVSALNAVVSELCSRRLVDEAKDVVARLKASIRPDGTTYSLLVVGFCRAGDLVSASKVWNAMSDDRLEPEMAAYNEMIATFFKFNRSGEAMAIFECLRSGKMSDLDLTIYRTVISWLCKEGKIERPLMLVAEMVKRGRISEGYKVLQVTRGEPDISVYHGLIKGLLRLRRAREATQVFREMTQRGIRPSMHTYIMLLQGLLGRRGRKATDPAVNFETVFVGGLVKMGRMLDATKYVERSMSGGTEVPRFDYNKFLRDFSNEGGVVMFEQVGRRLKETGMVDLGDVFLSYGEKMVTRDRRRSAPLLDDEPELD